MGTNSKMTERVAVVATIPPALTDDAVGTSDWASLVDGQQIMFVVQLGATDITTDAKVQEATDSSGTGAADITGLAITQLSATDDNKEAIILVRSSDLTAGNTHVALLITAGNGTLGSNIAGVGLRIDNRHDPATDNDVASVVEIITS